MFNNIWDKFFFCSVTRTNNNFVAFLIICNSEYCDYDDHNNANQRSKFWLSVRQKSLRATKNINVVVRRTTIIFHILAVKLDAIYLVPSTDNQNLIRTTRNCNLVVRGTTVYFFLLRTLNCKRYSFNIVYKLEFDNIFFDKPYFYTFRANYAQILMSKFRYVVYLKKLIECIHSWMIMVNKRVYLMLVFVSLLQL